VPSGFELDDKPGNWLYNRDRLKASPSYWLTADRFDRSGGSSIKLESKKGGDKPATPTQRS